VWAKVRRIGPWRFILLESPGDAIASAFGLIALGVAGAAYRASQAGATLDLHWFQIAGQPGVPPFAVYHHLVCLLPVGFLFALVFWLFARGKAWLLGESAFRQAPNRE
jgi:hypothetical protein